MVDAGANIALYSIIAYKKQEGKGKSGHLSLLQKTINDY